MTFKQAVGYAAIFTASSIAGLFLSSAVASAEPPPEPGVANAQGENPPPEEQREEPASQDCEPWCEVIEAAQQLPPPDWSGVGVPPLADVSVPVSFGIGLPDVVPDLNVPINPPSINLPAPQLPAFQAPPPPRFELPPPPKLGPPQLDLTPGF